ncbi:phage tail terminator-like protein [Limoniibacter endophyticus]|uniref:Uncharacterized protein n=1 Tax=Limoniibacter endophyticus TaxID=1565040 RepID=A0A8J3DJV9_9HYPH|nr:phage tail terminator-like protein [Limoniibacter endophyticus]GHC79383.1 hypothetical protein GCM10010136_31880 [Limoniibacter endophyticus]
MPSIAEDIDTALFARAAGLAQVTGLTIAWPNVAFPGKDATGKEFPKPPSYLRINHLPNVSQRLFINNPTHRRPGILQITIATPLNGGASAATRLAGKVAEHFPMDFRMTAGGRIVRVTKEPDIATAIRDDPSWLVPVSVSYEAFA